MKLLIAGYLSSLLFFTQCHSRNPQSGHSAFDSITARYSVWLDKKNTTLYKVSDSLTLQGIKLKILRGPIADNCDQLIVFSNNQTSTLLPVDCNNETYWLSTDSLKKLGKDTTGCFEYGLNQVLAKFNIQRRDQTFKLTDSIFKHLLHANTLSHTQVIHDLNTYESKLKTSSYPMRDRDVDLYRNWKTIANNYTLKDKNTVYRAMSVLRIFQITQIDQKSNGEIFIHIKSYKIPYLLFA
ncbi:hypothetical protein C8P68_11021 [Mucilaginibacter yixingensis]|uniref:Uncharacterized protein n=1 Tax=Mucilaginibacter yixingensis TaxID=1295612 RepID=A0A2T5J593_9SPHI|nr:hypothetical protein [Mucilaginibacter yixingensis]PTQ92890.1 hypothetical protein C8P68_11021 [Mucilaginibacter yixingensis]